MLKKTPEEAEQIRKDRKTLVRGAAITVGAGLGGLALLRKGRGGVVGRKAYLPPVKAAPVPPLKVALAPKPPGGAKGARANSVRKYGPAESTQRLAKAAGLKNGRGWDALKPTTTKKLGNATAADRKKFGKLDGQARAAKASPKTVFVSTGKKTRNGLPERKAVREGIVTQKEASMANRGARQKARQDLLTFRKTKNLSTLETPASRFFKERDYGAKARDVAVGAGAIASGAAAVHASRKIGKTSSDVSRLVGKLTPREIAREVGADVSGAAKRKLKGYFPTFIKGGKKVSKVMKAHVFSTPASRLIEFGGKDQLKEVNSNRYGDPLKAAAGLQRVYTRKDGHGNPVVEDHPLAHAQTLKAALRKGEKISRVATRGGKLGKDVVDTVVGKPRAKDAAGRSKKKEWEKSWFKEGVKKVAIGAGVLGYVGVLRKSPRARATHQRVVKKVTDTANRYVPDLVPRTHFSTPASHLFEESSSAKKKSSRKMREERKVLREARVRNALVGATAGSFLGGGLYGGKTGYGGARAGAAVGAAYGLLSNPKRRAAIEQLQTASFSTPASSLFHFDEVANDAGWDVRDPRGKSARVFAPGSRKRIRRPKEWHEKAENERKLWKAGLVVAALGAGAGGVAIGRRIPRSPANVIKVKFPKKKSG